MWPVRTRRGTRKRCAALFVVGICAAVMVVTRPFIMAPMTQLVDEVVALPPAPPLPLVMDNETILDQYADDTAPTEGGASVAAVIVAGKSLLSSSDSAAVPAVVVARKTQISSAAAVPITSRTQESTSPPPPSAGAPPSTTSVPTADAAGSPSSTAIVGSVSTSAQPPVTTSTVATTKARITTTTTTATTHAAVTHQRVAGALGGSNGTSAVAVDPRHDATYDQLPTIYVITPTFPRMEQMPELTRLGQTLKHVPKLFWIVADDAVRKSADVEALLKQLAMNYTYILGAMPDAYRKRKGNKPKGVANRMAGLQWIRKNADNNGVMFLADDDNSYDIRLFSEMRWTRKVSMWPVGLVTQLGVSTPVVRKGRVVDFYDGWIASRKFPVDMAGFAVNVGFLRSRPKAAMPFKAGFEEDGFLRSLNITLNDIEPKANNCTKIYVWHTRTVSNKVPQKLSAKDRKRFNNTNLFHLPHIV